MGDLKLVEPIAVPACSCAKCKRTSIVRAGVYLALRDRMDGPGDDRDRKQRLDGWHRYAPHAETAFCAMPERAAFAASAADVEVGALQRLLEWRAENWASSDDRNIVVLAGPKGTGKTLAAVWLAIYCDALAKPAFVTAHQLARLARIDEKREDLHDAATEEMLIVDDLGAERTDARAMTAEVDELVDLFYQGSGMLLVTTNLTAPQFRKRYGVRVVDRLAERGVWIQCTGPSLRGAPTKNGDR